MGLTAASAMYTQAWRQSADVLLGVERVDPEADDFGASNGSLQGAGLSFGATCRDAPGMELESKARSMKSIPRSTDRTMPTTTIDLLRYLTDAGIQRLHEGTQGDRGACPQHVKRTGHPDTHPSWSINKTTYLHFCQSCGYKGTLNSLLVDLLGAAPEDLEYDLNEQSFLRKMAEVRADPTQVLEPVLNLTEWGLSQPDEGRAQAAAGDPTGCDVEAIDHVSGPLEPRDQAVGDAVALSRPANCSAPSTARAAACSPCPPRMEKATTLFGYSVMSQLRLRRRWWSHRSMRYVSSASASHAVSSLGAWISAEQVRLLARTFTTVYMALDDDKAGHRGAEIATPTLRKQGAAVVAWSYHGLVDEEGQEGQGRRRRP